MDKEEVVPSNTCNREQYSLIIECARKGDLAYWNKQYDGNGQVVCNLEGADFSSQKLTGINLSGAKLARANFYMADLRGANLKDADLRGVNLEGADLTDAQMQKCKLSDSNLHSVILHMANLSGATLNNSYMAEAVLVKAELSETDLSGCDLTLAAATSVNFYAANLTGSILREAVLANAVLWKAKLVNADLTWAKLNDVDFSEADLAGANLSESYIEGARIRHAILRGARFHLACVDGRTVITDCMVDGNTDFTGVGLGSIRIEPRLYSRLMRNIRKRWWDAWIERRKIVGWFERINGRIPEMEPSHSNPRYVPKDGSFSEKRRAKHEAREWRREYWRKEFDKSKPIAILKGIVQVFEDIFVDLPVRIFWKMSDYGSKTLPIVGSFILLNVIFTIIYMILPNLPGMNPETASILGALNPVEGFMHTTMIIFSVTDVATLNLSMLPMFCAMVHVILGYFILAALVTRFAIMFQGQNT